MLLQKATLTMIKGWKLIYNEYRDRLYPNRKPASEIITYLKCKYPVTEVMDKAWEKVVIDNVLLNGFDARKLPTGKVPTATVFSVQNTDLGKLLYEKQDDIFRGMNINVGVELETAFFLVEGSSMLWDELFVFRGLDKDDLNNYYLVAEYINCLKKFDLLNKYIKL